ncbi:hypothetical protein HYW75_00460 [Candidatus Pacearchaeota archaeon]|nr:hypothetical protein [Candidatus Pacearchaeota archaeon]
MGHNETSLDEILSREKKKLDAPERVVLYFPIDGWAGIFRRTKPIHVEGNLDLTDEEYALFSTGSNEVGLVSRGVIYIREIDFSVKKKLEKFEKPMLLRHLVYNKKYSCMINTT